MRTITILIAITAFLSGCAKSGEGIVENEKKKWTNEGWEFVEVFGKPLDGSEPIMGSDSGTAGSVTAFTNDGKRLRRKEFKQTDSIYRINIWGNEEGETFSIVFKKQR